jgi:hypothetical protein
MAANYVLLGEITVGTAVASVTFSNIPQTGYTDLYLLFSPHTDRASYANADLSIEFNGSAVTAGKAVYSANTNTILSATLLGLVQGGNDALTANQSLVFGPSSLYIPNYTGSYNKSFSVDFTAEGNSTDLDQTRNGFSTPMWNNTAAITSIKLSPNGGTNWTQYSTFYLYGIAALGTTPVVYPKATGGDIIVNDGTYWYHTFRTSGVFTPSQTLSCDYLVVAGGGGGGTSSNGGYSAGGGGAGGLRSTVTVTGGGGSLESALSLTAQAYPVTIGAGGAGATTVRTLGVSGSNTTFATITSIGGGGGAAESTTLGQSQSIGRSGGSGGGGGTVVVGTGGGAGTANQGYAGGGGSAGYYGGGGGGAGAVGANAADTSGPGALGGVGVQITALATPTGTGVNSGFYGGGGTGSGYTTSTASNGGGGTGGAGSGGTGCSAGIANTGGGGGANTTQPSAAGGSGIVILRYTMA